MEPKGETEPEVEVRAGEEGGMELEELLSLRTNLWGRCPRCSSSVSGDMVSSGTPMDICPEGREDDEESSVSTTNDGVSSLEQNEDNGDADETVGASDENFRHFGWEFVEVLRFSGQDSW